MAVEGSRGAVKVTMWEAVTRDHPTLSARWPRGPRSGRGQGPPPNPSTRRGPGGPSNPSTCYAMSSPEPMQGAHLNPSAFRSRRMWGLANQRAPRPPPPFIYG